MLAAAEVEGVGHHDGTTGTGGPGGQQKSWTVLSLGMVPLDTPCRITAT